MHPVIYWGYFILVRVHPGLKPLYSDRIHLNKLLLVLRTIEFSPKWRMSLANGHAMHSCQDDVCFADKIHSPKQRLAQLARVQGTWNKEHLTPESAPTAARIGQAVDDRYRGRGGGFQMLADVMRHSRNTMHRPSPPLSRIPRTMGCDCTALKQRCFSQQAATTKSNDWIHTSFDDRSA